MLTYFASGLFLFIGFLRFYLDYTEKSLGTNLYLDQVFLLSQNIFKSIQIIKKKPLSFPLLLERLVL